MDNGGSKEMTDMKCSLEGCPGEYEEKLIVHTVVHKGEVIVIDHVPAEVCQMCGDILFKPETIRRIEDILKTTMGHSRSIPLYEYA
jgi:YgiT-type zinc finger domain-containing protein